MSSFINHSGHPFFSIRTPAIFCFSSKIFLSKHPQDHKQWTENPFGALTPDLLDFTCSLIPSSAFLWGDVSDFESPLCHGDPRIGMWVAGGRQNAVFRLLHVCLCFVACVRGCTLWVGFLLHWAELPRSLSKCWQSWLSSKKEVFNIQVRRVKEAKNTKAKKHAKRTFAERINSLILLSYSSITLKALPIENFTSLSKCKIYF